MNTNELLHVIQTLKETGFSHIDLTHEGSHILLSNSTSVGQTSDQGYYAPHTMPFHGNVPTFPHLHAGHMSAPVQTVGAATTATPTAAPAVSSIEEAVQVTAEENVSRENNQISNTKELAGHIIESPIVGTFYASSNPDSDPFVSVGATVKKGQVLCIIEAMKLMNEIESDVDGQVIEILVQNEQGVEYGQPLFKIV